MDRDWEGEWARVEAEYRDSHEAVRVLQNLTTEQEVAAYRRATDRFREAAKHRIHFVEERQRADPMWPSPIGMPPLA